MKTLMKIAALLALVGGLAACTSHSGMDKDDKVMKEG